MTRLKEVQVTDISIDFNITPSIGYLLEKHLGDMMPQIDIKIGYVNILCVGD